MPKLGPPPKVDQTTATGQAVTRARKIGQTRGTPAPAQPTTAKSERDPNQGIVTPEELDGLAEFDPETTSNPESKIADEVAAKRAAVEAAFAGADDDEPSAPATAVKRAARKAAPKKTASGSVVVAASDAWFAPLDETSPFINILYWGAEGSTKTTSAATAANAGNGKKVLFINAEGGLKKVALKKHGVDTSQIVVFPNPATDDVLDDESLERVFLRVQADLMADPTSWFAVVFDSLSDVNQRLTDQAQERRVQKLLGMKAANVDANFVDRDDYGVSAKILRKQLRRWRDLPCHLIVTALSRRDVDEDTSDVAYGPAVSPAVANDLMGYVDIAIYTRAGDGQRPVRGLTKEGGKYRVKDRYEVLPRVMVEPTFDRVLEYFNGETVEADDGLQEALTTAPAKTPGTVVQEGDTPTD